MSLFIGIDSGTQSTKAVVLDLETRQVVAEARASHKLIEGLPVGHMEQHPQDWTAAMDAVILEVAAKIDRSRVKGIGVSGQQHGFVPLDAKGRSDPPGEALVRHEHDEGMRAAHEEDSAVTRRR
ncbi:MAG: FGGY family carbohydrate kinase [Nibricoccus sp.]